MKIERWILDLLKETVDPWTVQFPSLTKEQCIAIILEGVRRRTSFLIGYKEHKTAFLINTQTEFVGDIHVFSNATNPWDIVKASRKMMKWIQTESPFIKIEGRSHLKDIITLAKRNKWDIEGYSKKSFVNKDGTLSDEVIFGFVVRK
jgi:hypothetical protein